jgi:ABC-2 type transport system permease protein
MRKLLLAIIKKELGSYLVSPLAYIFIVIFLIFQMGFTFILGRLYDSNSASLEIFFMFHPWLYLFLVPAAGMRLWAEEKSEGTIETLFTLPVPVPVIILGKFIASWIFILISLALTFPVVITVYYLGSPDFGPVFTGYLFSWLMAGAFLAITCFTSALTKNQVISFVLSVITCFVFVLLGYGVFQQYLSFLPVSASDFLTNLGFIPHFQMATRGVIDTRDVLFFISIILYFLVLNTAALEKKKIS